MNLRQAIMGLLIAFIVGGMVAFAAYQIPKQRKNFKRQSMRNAAIQELESMFGQCSASAESVTLKVFAFDSARKLSIDNDTISYDDIKGCSLDSYDKEIEVITAARTETTYTTKTDGKSLAGRAVAGAIVAGPVGAAIGGLTAKKSTTATTREIPASSRARHDSRYKLTITTSDRTITKDTPNGNLVQDIKGIIDRIIATGKAEA
jgi:hypothetical protein